MAPAPSEHQHAEAVVQAAEALLAGSLWTRRRAST